MLAGDASLEPWCSGLTCLPVTQKIAGSNPVGSACPYSPVTIPGGGEYFCCHAPRRLTIASAISRVTGKLKERRELRNRLHGNDPIVEHPHGLKERTHQQAPLCFIGITPCRLHLTHIFAQPREHQPLLVGLLDYLQGFHLIGNFWQLAKIESIGEKLLHSVFRKEREFGIRGTFC